MTAGAFVHFRISGTPELREGKSGIGKVTLSRGEGLHANDQPADPQGSRTAEGQV